MYRESTNGRNMQNKAENDCESLWGTALAEASLVAATVRLFGDYDTVRRDRRPPDTANRPLRSSKRSRSTCPLTDIPKKSPLHTTRTPYPLTKVPKESPPVAHIHSAICCYVLVGKRSFAEPTLQGFKCSISNSQGAVGAGSLSYCELTQSQYRANMANSSLNKGSDGASGHRRSTARHDEAKITEIIGGSDTS